MKKNKSLLYIILAVLPGLYFGVLMFIDEWYKANALSIARTEQLFRMMLSALEVVVPIIAMLPACMFITGRLSSKRLFSAAVIIPASLFIFYSINCLIFGDSIAALGIFNNILFKPMTYVISIFTIAMACEFFAKGKWGMFALSCAVIAVEVFLPMAHLAINNALLGVFYTRLVQQVICLGILAALTVGAERIAEEKPRPRGKPISHIIMPIVLVGILFINVISSTAAGSAVQGLNQAGKYLFYFAAVMLGFMFLQNRLSAIRLAGITLVAAAVIALVGGNNAIGTALTGAYPILWDFFIILQLFLSILIVAFGYHFAVNGKRGFAILAGIGVVAEVFMPLTYQGLRASHSISENAAFTHHIIAVIILAVLIFFTARAGKLPVKTEKPVDNL